jgi:hypothetical protein
VEGAKGVEGFEDHEVEGALQDFGFFGVHFVPLDIAKKIAGVLWNVHRAGIAPTSCVLRCLRARLIRDKVRALFIASLRRLRRAGLR